MAKKKKKKDLKAVEKEIQQTIAESLKAPDALERLNLESRVDKLEERLDRLIQAIDKSKKVRGI